MSITTDIEKQVLDTLRDMPRCVIKELRKATGIPDADIKAVLDKAIEEGVVKVYGGGCCRCYEVLPQ